MDLFLPQRIAKLIDQKENKLLKGFAIRVSK